MPFVLHNAGNIRRSRSTMYRHKEKWLKVTPDHSNDQAQCSNEVLPQHLNATIDEKNEGENTAANNEDVQEEFYEPCESDEDVVKRHSEYGQSSTSNADNDFMVEDNELDEDGSAYYLVATDDEDDGSSCCSAYNMDRSEEDEMNDEFPEEDEADIDPPNTNVVKHCLRKKLRRWDAQNRCTRKAGDELLEILRYELKRIEVSGVIPTLPSCWRSIQRLTKKEMPFPLNVESKCGGDYMYFGIEKNLNCKLFCNNPPSEATVIEIGWNTDGVDTAISSNNSFWPIWGRYKKMKPFLIALYYGIGKPKDFNAFQEDFVQEATHLKKSGVMICNKVYNFKLYYFVADTPAKAACLNVKAPTGYFSCPQCKVPGRRLRSGKRRSNIHFLEVNAAPRSSLDYKVLTISKKKIKRSHRYAADIDNDNDDVRNSSDEDDDFHHGPTILSELEGFDLVKNVIVDSMHGAYGAGRRLILAFLEGFAGFPAKVRPILSCKTQRAISEALIDIGCKNLHPSDFARRPRSLRFIHKWKCTEIRQFLLYTGVTLLRPYLPQKHYECFVTLCAAVRYLNMFDEYTPDMVTCAKELLEHFISISSELYGGPFVTHIVHLIYHSPDNAGTYGPIDEVSCFEFENANRDLKAGYRGGSRPLEQVANYYNKKVFHEMDEELDDKFEPHRGFRIGECIFRTDREGDRYCSLASGELVQIEAFTSHAEIVGRPYSTISSLFECVVDSQELGIYKCRNPSTSTIKFSIEDITSKFYAVPHHDPSTMILSKLVHVRL